MRRLLIPLLVSSSLITCAARRGPNLTPPEAVVSVAADASQDRLAAIASLEALVAKPDSPDQLRWALLWAGEQRRLAGDTEPARAHFGRLAEEHPTHPLRDGASLGLALLAAEENLSGNALATLQLIGDKGIPPSMNADRYRILARLGADERTAPNKVREHVRKAVAYAQGDEQVEGRVRRSLADLLDHTTAATLAEGSEASTAEERALEKIRTALADRELEQVQAQGSRFLSTWPENEHVDEVKALIRRADAGDPVIDGVIGVLLPLTGDYAPAAARLRSVIELAAEGRGVRLVFRDTAGDPAQAVTALDQLVLEDGAVAVLGPLRKESVLAAATQAQDFRVPMVALTQSGRPTELGEFVYRGFLPVEQQVAALVTHAMTDRPLKRFAVLHPSTPYGETASELFTAEVEARGGEVVRAVSYDPAASDFLEPARTLGQKDYEERASEFYRIKREFKEKGFDEDKAMLPPIVDFDAIFIPDNWRRVALVASSLAYEEFPVGGFRPNRHAEPIPLLGLNAWNAPRIVEAGAHYVRDAVFVDAFQVDSESAATQGFVGEYKTAFGRAPQVMDAVTYDATRLLTLAVLGAGASRDAAREQLSEVTLPEPIAGGARFGEDREVARELLLLTVGKEDIHPWLPPEEELPPEGLPEGAP